MKGLPTIRDVARHAGVGIATVSRVLNEHAAVDPETRARVLEAIDALGYKPSQAARTLVTRSSRTFGLLIPDIRNSFYPRLARGFEDEAHKEGYGVILADTDEDLDRQAVYLDMLLENRVAGVAFTGSTTPAEQVTGLRRRGVAVASANLQHASLGISTVNVDSFAAALEATRYLLQMGHRTIAHIAAPQRAQVGRARLDGYRKALADAGLSADDSLVHHGDFLLPSGYEGTIQLMQSRPDITAIFGATDLMAIGALKALRRLKLSCPAQVSVVGFNDLEEAEMVEPELTTVATDPYQQGRSFAQLLIRQIQAPESTPVQKLIPFRLIVRQSTRPLSQHSAS